MLMLFRNYTLLNKKIIPNTNACNTATSQTIFKQGNI
jgi:hypothetical protein